jgi:hypothetical protein
MKATLLLIIGAASLGLTGCESDLPPDEKPKVTFGNDQYRDDTYSRPVAPATDLEKTPW